MVVVGFVRANLAQLSVPLRNRYPWKVKFEIVALNGAEACLEAIEEVTIFRKTTMVASPPLPMRFCET